MFNVDKHQTILKELDDMDAEKLAALEAERPSIESMPCPEEAASRMVAIASRKKWQWEDFWHECTAYGLACQEYGRRLERGEVKKPKAMTPDECMAMLKACIDYQGK
jgi:hypothetical protein